MLDKFAAFLGTDLAFWLTMAVTALCGVLAFFSPDVATFILSVVAIILPSIILVRDSHERTIASERDKAMHKKLDELVVVTEGADNNLAGSEPDNKVE